MSDEARKAAGLDGDIEARVLLAERKLGVLSLHHETLATQIGEALTTIKGIADSTRQQLELGEDRMSRIEKDLAANTSATTRVAEDTREVLEHMATAKSGLKLLGYVGVVIKWLSIVGGGLVGIYVAAHTAWYVVTHNGDVPPSSKP